MSTHEVKKIISDSVNVSGGHDLYTVKIVGTQVNYNLTSTNGTVTNNQMLFNNVNLPSLSNSVIQRLFRVRYQVKCSIDGATPPVALPNVALTGLGPTMALVDFPLSTCTDSLQLIINSQTATVPLRQAFGLLKRSFPKEFLKRYGTEAPAMQDQTPALARSLYNVTGTANPVTAINVFGFPTSNQPLSSFYNCDMAASRASFYPIASDGTSVTYEIVEPVLCSPCSIFDREAPFSNFNTLSVQYSMSNLGQMFVMANGANYPAGYAVTMQPTAYLELVVASIDNQLINVPRSLEYHWENIQVYSNNVATVILTDALKEVSGSSSTLRLTNMPSKIVIACRPNVNAIAQQAVAGNPAFADACLAWGPLPGAGIKAGAGFSLTINNRSGLFATTSVFELWRLSVKNGLNQSFAEWKSQGGVIILTASDIGLSLESGDLYEGLSGNVNLSVSGQWNNSNYIYNATQLGAGDWAPDAVQMNVDVLTVTDGIAYIQPDSCNFNTAYLTASEINMALKSADAYIPESAVEGKDLGGALWGSGKTVINSTARPAGSKMVDMGGAMSAGILTGGKLKHKK